jgi:hypothetical protein
MLDPDPDSQHWFYYMLNVAKICFYRKKSIGCYNPVKWRLKSFTHKESGTRWQREKESDTNFLFCFLDSGDITVIKQFPMHTVQIMWGSQNLNNFLIAIPAHPPSPQPRATPPLISHHSPLSHKCGLLFLWFFTPRIKLFFPLTTSLLLNSLKNLPFTKSNVRIMLRTHASVFL